MPPKRGRSKDVTNKKAPKQAKVQPQPHAAVLTSAAPAPAAVPTSDTYIPASKVKQLNAQIEKDTVDAMFSFNSKDKDQTRYRMPHQEMTILLGDTEVKLLKLLISEKHDNEPLKFAEYLNLKKISFPSPKTDSQSFLGTEIGLIGSSQKIALAAVFIAYYLYNKSAQLIANRVGTYTSNYTIVLLLNKFVYQKLENHSYMGQPIIRVLKEKGITNVSASNGTLFEFSNLISLSLTGNIESLMRCVSVLTVEYNKAFNAVVKPKKGTTRKASANENGDIFIPKGSYLNYKSNPAHLEDPSSAFLNIADRAGYAENSYEMKQQRNILLSTVFGDSLINKPTFLRIPFLGIFQDPDLILKNSDPIETPEEEINSMNAKVIEESSKKLTSYKELLRKAIN